MSKRTWMAGPLVLVVAMVLGACGGGELADDLTPIPTLPKGEEPALVDALQATPEPVDTPAAEDIDEAEADTAQLVAMGEELFVQCEACHGAVDGAGPALTGMGEVAATRVEGMSAKEYLYEAIVEPSAHLVEGFSDIMPKNYGDQFSENELQALIAYILAEGGGDAEVAEEPVAAATAGDSDRGEGLFAAACSACHGAADGAGPALTGMGARAATRVDGMPAEDYLHEAIVEPSAYLVQGFGDIMPKTYADQFSETELADIVAYILTQ